MKIKLAVDSEGKVNFRILAEVSEVNATFSASNLSFRTHRAETHLQIKYGQMLVIAGC